MIPTALNRKVLVVNDSGMPINIVKAFDALCDMFSGRAVALEQHAHYDFEAWVENWEDAIRLSKVAQERVAHAASYDVVVPEIIKMTNYKDYQYRRPRCSRGALFKRDHNTCQYCGNLRAITGGPRMKTLKSRRHELSEIDRDLIEKYYAIGGRQHTFKELADEYDTSISDIRSCIMGAVKSLGITLEQHPSNLNLDHVKPRCKGGRNTWTNLVVSCIVCNTEKDNKTPEDAGVELLRKPFEPHWTMIKSDVNFRNIPKSWEDFLGVMYMNTELSESR
jgi:5-methylcytosine-specific restriction endonuclease McrA